MRKGHLCGGGYKSAGCRVLTEQGLFDCGGCKRRRSLGSHSREPLRLHASMHVNITLFPSSDLWMNSFRFLAVSPLTGSFLYVTHKSKCLFIMCSKVAFAAAPVKCKCKRRIYHCLMLNRAVVWKNSNELKFYFL